MPDGRAQKVTENNTMLPQLSLEKGEKHTPSIKSSVAVLCILKL